LENTCAVTCRSGDRPVNELLSHFQQIQAEAADPAAELEAVLQGDAIRFRPGARFLQAGRILVGGCFLGGLFVVVPLVQFILHGRDRPAAWIFMAVWLVLVGLGYRNLPYFTSQRVRFEIDTRRGMLKVFPSGRSEMDANEIPLDGIDAFVLLRADQDDERVWHEVHALMQDDRVQPVAFGLLNNNDTARVTAERLAHICGKPVYGIPDGLEPRLFVEEVGPGERRFRRTAFPELSGERCRPNG
jgi:hypothetical protein